MILNIPIRMIPIPDNVDVAKSIWVRIKQASVWFLGVTFFRSDYKITSEIKHISPSRKIWFYCYRVYRNLVWMFRAPLVLGLFILGLYFQYWTLSLAMLFAYLYLPAITTVTVSKPKIKKSNTGGFKPTDVKGRKSINIYKKG